MRAPTVLAIGTARLTVPRTTLPDATSSGCGTVSTQRAHHRSRPAGLPVPLPLLAELAEGRFLAGELATDVNVDGGRLDYGDEGDGPLEVAISGATAGDYGTAEAGVEDRYAPTPEARSRHESATNHIFSPTWTRMLSP